MRFSRFYGKISFSFCTWNYGRYSPGWGGGQRLARLLGTRIALRIFATAAKISAKEALAIGLADAVGKEGEDLDTVLKTFLAPFKKMHPDVLCGMKKVISAYEKDIATTAKVEMEVFRSLWGGPVNKKVLAEFSMFRQARKTGSVSADVKGSVSDVTGLVTS